MLATNGGRMSSIWEEAGMEHATPKEKADFWRQNLRDEAKSFYDYSTFDRALEPLLEEALALPAEFLLTSRGRRYLREMLDKKGGVAFVRKKLQQRIYESSDAEIVIYGNKHYARLPTLKSGYGLSSW
jgi:hypothetical protein